MLDTTSIFFKKRYVRNFKRIYTVKNLRFFWKWYLATSIQPKACAKTLQVSLVVRWECYPNTNNLCSVSDLTSRGLSDDLAQQSSMENILFETPPCYTLTCEMLLTKKLFVLEKRAFWPMILGLGFCGGMGWGGMFVC